MKILFVVKGLGEYSQAQPIAKIFQKNNEQISFITEDKFVKEIIINDRFDLIEYSTNINSLLKEIKADALFLCNSHTTNIYQLERPKNIKKIFSLDSNWLFNNKKYLDLGLKKFYTYEWIDHMYVVFPKSIFEANLKENKGYYDIDKFFKNKIYCPGFIPSGETYSDIQKRSIKNKFNIRDDVKVISVYFGNHQFHSDVYNQAVKDIEHKIGTIINELHSNNSIIDYQMIKLNGNHIDLNIKDSISFDEEIAISDLVIMHYGYGTLPKIFHKQIPVISLIPKVNNDYHTNFYELSPCIRKNALKYLIFDEFNIRELKELILSMIFDKNLIENIKINQKKLFEKGEDNLIKHFYQSYK